jgi:two-component system response regulator YesN
MRKIVIVDDEPFIRKGIIRFIDWESEGFTVAGEAEDGAEAFDVIRDIVPDLVICDIKMPKLDGLSLIEKVKDNLSHPPVFLILSSYDDFNYARRAITLSVQNYLLKPLQKEELLSELKKIRRYLAEQHAYNRGTKKETEMFKAVLNGDVEEIGDLFGISVPVVRSLLCSVMRFQILPPCKENAADALKGVLSEIFVYHGKSLLTVYNDCEFDCVYIKSTLQNSLPMNSKLTMNNLRDELDKFCRDYHVRIRGFMGSTEDGLQNIGKSRQSLGDKITESFYSDEMLTFLQQGPGIQDFARDPNMMNELEMLPEYIRSLSAESVKTFLRQFRKVLQKERLHPETVVKSIHSVMLEIIRTVSNMGGNLEDYNLFSNGIPDIAVSLGCEEILSRLESFSDSTIRYLTSIHADTRNPVVREVELYISEHLTDTILVKDLAKHVNLHPYYLGQLFKNIKGVSVKEFINMQRVEKAKSLISRNDLRVTDVAEIVGYRDPEYFYKKFKKYTGMTPRQYEKKRD